MSRVTKPFRQLGWLLATLVLGSVAAVSTGLIVLLSILVMWLLLALPCCLLLIPVVLAGVMWLVLMLPSLVVRGDFRWPCQVALWLCRPFNAASDWLTDADDDWIFENWVFEMVERLWGTVGATAARLEGCD